MSKPLFTDADREALAELISEKRDEHPRDPRDMDSWDLADAVIEWVEATFSDRVASAEREAEAERELRRDIVAAVVAR